MVDVSYHRKCGFAFLPPTTHAGPRATSRDRLSPRAATLFVILASLLLWAIIAAIICAIVGVA